MYGGLVLAAGASTRLGQPKALISLGDEPTVARAAKALRRAGCADVVVVVGADRDRVEPAVPPPARAVPHAAWASGRTGSLKAGLRALPDALHVVVWPIDHPAVTDRTLRALLAAPGAIRLPVHEGRRGHPTVFERGLRAELLSLRDDQPLHDVVHADPSRVREIPVNDPGVLLNVDDPEDLRRLEGLAGRR